MVGEETGITQVLRPVLTPLRPGHGLVLPFLGPLLWGSRSRRPASPGAPRALCVLCCLCDFEGKPANRCTYLFCLSLRLT